MLETSHNKTIEISEESLLRLSNPEHFKYSNFNEWLRDRNAERWKQFGLKILSVITIGLLLLGVYIQLIDKEVCSILIALVLGLAGSEVFKKD